MTRTILHIDTSARLTGSTTRSTLSRQVPDHLRADKVIRRHHDA